MTPHRQLELFDLNKPQASDGTFCTKRTLKRENRFRESIKYVLSITDFQPMRIRQLSERILELEEEVRHLKNVNYNIKNKPK